MQHPKIGAAPNNWQKYIKQTVRTGVALKPRQIGVFGRNVAQNKQFLADLPGE